MKTRKTVVSLTNRELLQLAKFLIELAESESYYHPFVSTDHRRAWEINRFMQLMHLALRGNPV